MSLVMLKESLDKDGLTVNQHWVRQWLAACLVPSHYLKYCWPTVNYTFTKKHQQNLNQMTMIFIQQNAFQDVFCIMVAISFRFQYVNILGICHSAWGSVGRVGLCPPLISSSASSCPEKKCQDSCKMLLESVVLQNTCQKCGFWKQWCQTRWAKKLISPVAQLNLVANTKAIWPITCHISPVTVTHVKNTDFMTGPAIFNTLRPRQNGRLFTDDTYKCIFLNKNVRISITISLKFVPKGLINNIPALVLIMAWHRPGDKPLSEAMMVRSLTHICVTRPQWVKWMVRSQGWLFIDDVLGFMLLKENACILIWISPNLVPFDPTDNKPLPEPLLIQFNVPYLGPGILLLTWLNFNASMDK